MYYTTNEQMYNVLSRAKTIAVVGHSDKPHRTSYQIASYLRRVGYTVIPVNPAVTEIEGLQSYASLAEVPMQIDIVNVFRRAEYLPEIMQEAADLSQHPMAIWGQLGVEHPTAGELAKEADILLVMNKCIKVERERLLSQ